MPRNVNLSSKRNLNSYFSISQQQKMLKFFKENKSLELKEVLLALEKNISIPGSIFLKQLGCLECICKFLKEHHKLSNIEIAKLTNRSSKSIWQAISQARRKYPKNLIVKKDSIMIPIKILENKKLSILENIVYYLKNKNLSYHEIAELLARDDRTIWTVYQKAIKKLNKNK